MLSVFIINSIIVAVVVIVHYEFLYRIVLYMPRLNIKHSYTIVFGVFGALIAHVIEIWIFAAAYYFMNLADGWGNLTGNFNGSLMDCAYFSFTVFSTVGFGDIEPVGDLRYLTGIESLTGLVLITWTASFLYFEMQKQWSKL
ncbi:potassium channel family protein [Paraglaciecola sp. 25GB23A]|uniref:potassium channel family protein n=1 Tax=Paraglaciecola sp. 25GB23A TaxID=3156068 RepID=UPI0032B01A00|tara:strand:- start:4051 stop:4476 length:426 start_codon:yes stop_codon:yes gene_type:complete